MTNAARHTIPLPRCLSLLFEAPDNPERRAELADGIAAGLMPWQRILSDGASPYFFDRIRKAGLESELPADVRNSFQNLLIEQTGRNIVMLRELDAIVAALNKCGITPVLLKGAALLHEVYKHPGFRRLADIDLLIRKSEMASAASAVAAIGYMPAGGRGHHENFAAQREFPVMLELHTALFNPDDPLQRLAFPIDAGEMTSRAIQIKTGGGVALSFRAEDQFIYLACHAAKERFGSLKHVVDLYEIVKMRNINWEEIFIYIQKNKITIKIYYMVDLLIDYGIIIKLPRNRRYLALRGKTRLLQKEERRTLKGIGKLLYCLKLVEGRTRKGKALFLFIGFLIRGGRSAADV
ncbi:MAG: nucleotidyltransferase family protein [bacterium]